MKSAGYYLILTAVLAGGAVPGQGFITGDSGGNEQGVAIFDR